MNKYFSYFKYVVEHKKNVFIECFKRGLYIHAFTHDLSKFRPSEFIPYAKFFYSNNRTKKYENNVNKTKDKKFFKDGFSLHQKRNKHHNTFWTVIVDGKIETIEMPERYLKQMVCDFAGMSRKFGGSPREHYIKNRGNITLHPISREKFEKMLGVSDAELQSV